MAKKTAPSKTVRKELKTLKKGVKKTKRIDRKQDLEIAKLKADLVKLKKRGTKKKRLSEYNLFIRRQLKAGRTFIQAVRLWKRQLKATKRLKRKPIARVARKAVRKRTKAKRKRRIRLKVRKIVKLKVRRKAKPKLKRKPKVKRKAKVVKKVARKKFEQRRVKSSDTSKRLEEIALMLSKTQKASHLHTQKVLESVVDQFKQSGSFGTIKAADEEIALHLAGLYFREVARLGFKRSLELDAVINAYFYALARVKRREFESREISDVLEREKR